MKKLTVSIFTSFFVLFSSVFVTSAVGAEETLNIPIGQAKTNKNVYGPETEKTELVEEKLPPNQEYQALPVQGENAVNISKAGVNPDDMYQTYTKDGKVRFVYKKDINFKPTSNDSEKGTFIPDREVSVYDVKTTTTEKTELVEGKIPPNREYQAVPVQGVDAVNISKAGVNPDDMYQTYTEDGKVRFVYKKDINFKPSLNDPEKGTFIPDREVSVYDVKTTTTEQTKLVEEIFLANKKYQAVPLDSQDTEKIKAAGVNPDDMYLTYTEDEKIHPRQKRYVYKKDIKFLPLENDSTQGHYIPEKDILVYDIKNTTTEKVELIKEELPVKKYEAVPLDSQDTEKVKATEVNPEDMYRTYTEDGKHEVRYVYKKDIKFLPLENDPTKGHFVPNKEVSIYDIKTTTTEKTELIEEKLPVKKYQAVPLEGEDAVNIKKAEVNPEDMYRTYTEDDKVRFVYKKDITFLPSENGSTQGTFIPDKEVSIYDVKTTTTPKPLLVAKGTDMDVYEYKNGQFFVTLQTTKEQKWLNEADIDFDLTTKDKETPVGASIGTIVALDANRTIFGDSNGTSPKGTLTFDSFKTKLDVKGKTNGFYNVGLNQWVNGNPDAVRFFPAGVKTNLYKLVYDARDLEDSPYKENGITEAGFDNTGFIYRVFKDQGYRVGKFTPQTFEKIAAKVTKPQIGDLIFIKDATNETKTVGIIIDKDGKYIAATEKDGVKVYDFKTTDTNISGFGRLR